MKTTSLNCTDTMFAPQNYSEVLEYRAQIIALYKEVFGDDIWREGKKCVNCNTNYSFTEAKRRDNSCCQSPLMDFYTDDELDLMLKQIAIRQFQMRLIFREKVLVAMQWGWLSNLDELNKEKLDLDYVALAKLISELKKRGVNLEQFYYRAESGVIPNFRRQGFARKMYASVCEDLRPLIKFALSRTTPRSPQFLFSQKLGDQIVFRYEQDLPTIEDDRVIFLGNI